jgi:hypothetical protein
MKFGLLKSKIEKCLLESYTNDGIKRDLFVFNEFFVKNKNLNKLYYIYDELSTNKGLEESIANEFINECITIYENTINKIDKSIFNEIELWVGHIKTKNEYEDIDNLFSTSLLKLENKIKSKKFILENLKKSEEKEQVLENVSINEMVEIANKTIKNYLSNLSENEKRKLEKILLESDKNLKVRYDLIKEDVLDKLVELKSNESDSDILSKINETINKISSEEYDKLNYFKLQQLNRSL